MIAAFRMYNAVPRAAAAWRALFERAFAAIGADIRVIDHGWPDPIDALWSREDLACGFMCGWPFARSGRMLPIAAPVPSPPRYEGLPRYCSDFLVREASGWRSVEDAFGHRFGWMAENSQSGFNAPRAHLARFVSSSRPALFAESVGPLGTPARTLEALRSGTVDLVALDGYYLDLVRHHEPARLAGLRCVGSTPWTPIPLLVAAPGTDEGMVRELRGHLLQVHGDAGSAGAMADALVSRFVAPDPEAYGVFEAQAREAERSGYATIR